MDEAEVFDDETVFCQNEAVRETKCDNIKPCLMVDYRLIIYE